MIWQGTVLPDAVMADYCESIDQLNRHDLYHLGREMKSAGGDSVFPAGTEFLFDHCIVDLMTRSFDISGHCGPGRQPVTFATRAWEHRQIFEFHATLDNYVPRKPGALTALLGATPEPPLTDASLSRWLDGVPGFENAVTILANGPSNSDWGSTLSEAKVLESAARQLADEYPSVARYLAGRSLSFYRCWMSQATSGGEAAAMEDKIRENVRRLRVWGA